MLRYQHDEYRTYYFSACYIYIIRPVGRPKTDRPHGGGFFINLKSKDEWRKNEKRCH